MHFHVASFLDFEEKCISGAKLPQNRIVNTKKLSNKDRGRARVNCQYILWNFFYSHLNWHREILHDLREILLSDRLTINDTERY